MKLSLIFTILCGLFASGFAAELHFGHAEEASEELDFAVAEGMKLIGFKLTLLPEQNDYANCAGEYMEYPDVVVRDWPIYYNEDKNRIAFYSGSKWKVTSMNYLEAIKGGATGGFYGGQTTTAGPATKMVWRPRYSVRGKYGRT